MTSATSHSKSRGFSLVEILVVIGIILVLAGIALPMLVKAYSHASKSAARFNLNTVAVGLEAYKNDQGDYPRCVGGPGLGCAVLCKAMFGIGNTTDNVVATVWNAGSTYKAGDLVYDNTVTPNVYYIAAMDVPSGAALSGSTGTPAVPYWTQFTLGDGADGAGFRLRAGTGKVYGPYLQPDRFKFDRAYICDRDGNPILYYPANTAKPDLSWVYTGGTGPVGSTRGSFIDIPGQGVTRTVPTPTTAMNLQVLYNFTDNVGQIGNTALDLQKMRALFGDVNFNGQQDVNEVLMQAPYILWSPGADGAFKPAGTLPRDVTACDDVINFQR